MMATTVEGMNADTRSPHFDSTTDPSPLLQASYQALQRDYWTSLASSRQQRTTTPTFPTSATSRVEFASTLSSPPATPPPTTEAKQNVSPKDNQPTFKEGGCTRKRERPAVSSPPSHSNQISPHLLHALQLAKEEPDDDGEEEGRAVRDDISSRETNDKTTTLDLENKAIFAFWSRLMERFGGRQANKDGSVCPEAVLLEIMEIISFYASNEISMQDAFTKLAALFRRNKCIDLYEDLVGLLLQQNVRKEFLIKKGIDIAFLSKKTKKEDEDMEQEETEGTDDDDEAEEEGDDDDEEEEEELDKRPTKRTRRASKQPPSRKRKSSSEATYTPKKAKPQQEESGRLRRSPDKWTPEEDDKLIALVEKHGTGTKKWRQIAEELGTTKNSSKCAQHWRRVLAPNIHKGSWTAEEEEKLLMGVEKYGLTQWTLVAKEIPGRTDIQCRYHYMRQQNSRACSWTGEEEKLLEGLVAKYGSDDVKCWVYISDELAESKIRRTPRTALECQQHWATMKKREGAKKLKKQK